MAVKKVDPRQCMWDFKPDRDEHFACWRPALLGRRLCHKHAGQQSKLLARRRRNVMARATRKAAR